jgi:hypothetical protein
VAHHEMMEGPAKGTALRWGRNVGAGGHQAIAADVPACDLLIVIGTSLQVSPSAHYLFLRPRPPRLSLRICALPTTRLLLRLCQWLTVHTSDSDGAFAPGPCAAGDAVRWVGEHGRRGGAAVRNACS